MDQQDRPTPKPDIEHEHKPVGARQLTPQEQLFVESQNHCALCSSPLQIKVETYLDDFYLREEAACPVCKVKTRTKNHKIH